MKNIVSQWDSRLNLISNLLKYYIIFVLIFITSGIILDLTNNLGSFVFWKVVWVGIIFVTFYSIFRWIKNNFIKQNWIQIKTFLGKLKTIEKILVLSTTLITTINFFSALFLYPYNWDGMTYHLARIKYFIQHQNTDFFEANYWAQITHTLYSSYLNIAFLSLGDERAMNFVQFVAGLFAALSVIGITLKISHHFKYAILAGCIFLNLTQVNLQMTSTQNDLLMSSLFGCTVYFMLLWFQKRTLQNAFFSSISCAIGLGVKGSWILFMPVLLFLLLYLFIQNYSFKKVSHFLIMPSLLVFVFFTSGYSKNLVRFNHPIGNNFVLEEHSFKDISIDQQIKIGLRNTVRYMVHFASLDGFPDFPPIVKLHQKIQKAFLYPFVKIGIDVYDFEQVRKPFVIAGPYSNENVAYWGILGFLIWPIVLLILVIKSGKTYLPFALASIFFLLTQAFAVPYDPWRGRFFISCAVLAVPTTAVIWPLCDRNSILKQIVNTLLLLACISSLTTLLFRLDRPLLPYQGQKSVLQMNRLEQLTAERKSLYDPLKAITQWIDRYPHLTLYTILPGDFYEYPLFRGNDVVPLKGFISGFKESQLQEIQQGLLLYDNRIYTDQKPQDIYFGENLFGRVIQPE